MLKACHCIDFNHHCIVKISLYFSRSRFSFDESNNITPSPLDSSQTMPAKAKTEVHDHQIDKTHRNALSFYIPKSTL